MLFLRSTWLFVTDESACLAYISLYWLGRMLAGGEDPLYVAHRVVRMAAEDIGIFLLLSSLFPLSFSSLF